MPRRKAYATGILSVLLAGAVTGAPAAQAGKQERATETHTMAYDRFLYTCKGTSTEARCKATDADRPDESIKWRITKTGMNVWNGEGRIGPNRITWTVSGTQVPTYWQQGVGPDHLRMTGSGDQSRGEAFTFSYGDPWSPGQTVTGGHSLGGYVVCGGFGEYAMQPPLGANCSMATGPAEVLMVLAPVYPGAELVDP